MTSISTLTVPRLSELRCPYCDAAIELDESWVSASLNRWNWVGLVAGDEEGVLGVVALSPLEGPEAAALHVRRGARLRWVWVHPDATGQGLGRRLVQSAAAQLLQLDVSSIVAVGARTRPTCTAPVRDWLRATGFAPTPTKGYLKLDLASTASWLPELRDAFSRWVGAVRPLPPPEPAGRLARTG